jgi:hypothetical protein
VDYLFFSKSNLMVEKDGLINLNENQGLDVFLPRDSLVAFVECHVTT